MTPGIYIGSFIFISLGLYFIHYAFSPINRDEDPTLYSWEKTRGVDDHYTQKKGFVEWILYKGASGNWTLDKIPKYCPGVIRRFEKYLTDIDLVEADNLINCDAKYRERAR